MVLQTLHGSFFLTPSSHILLGYSTNTSCASLATGAAANNSAPNLKNNLTQCPATNQLVTQIFTLMGSYFPINMNGSSGANNKKLSGILSNLRQSSNGNVPKPMFNMFMPIMFVAHAHMNGSVSLVTGNANGGAAATNPSTSSAAAASSSSPSSPVDYGKQLADAYMPFLTFFDWLCKVAIFRYGTNNKLFSVVDRKSATLAQALASTESSSHTNSSPAAVAYLVQIKQLIDLILIVTLNASVLNISFVHYLNDSLFVKKRPPPPPTAAAAGKTAAKSSEHHSESTSSSSSSDASPGKSSSCKRRDDKEIREEFMEILVQSPMLPQFVNAMLTNFRYHLNLKEIYRFIHAVMPRCIVIAGKYRSFFRCIEKNLQLKRG